MKSAMKKLGLSVLSASAVFFLFVHLFTGIANADSLPECITDSDEDSGSTISPAPCGIYRIITTRQENFMGGEVDVTVQYMMHIPDGSPRALVVLFAGGRGNTGITGDVTTGEVTAAGNNFLVRSAQLFAERGYLTVTIDRPSTGPATNAEFDRYRVSASHAQDIVAVISAVVDELGTANLPVLLAGTSRGAISVVAQNMLGVGISLSSPVTSASNNPANLYVGRPDQPRLQPSFVEVPVHTLAHKRDGCFVSAPDDAKELHRDFKEADVVRSRFDRINGGFEVSANPCSARTFHGFLGIETKAVKKTAKRLDKVLEELNKDFPENNKPVANATSVSTTAPVNIDLSTLSSDADGDALSFSLPRSFSSRGADLSIAGSVVTYAPAGTGITDGFVYIASDGKEGVSSAVVTVEVN